MPIEVEDGFCHDCLEYEYEHEHEHEHEHDKSY
jgi:hypothetical protein